MKYPQFCWCTCIQTSCQRSHHAKAGLPSCMPIPFSNQCFDMYLYTLHSINVWPCRPSQLSQMHCCFVHAGSSLRYFALTQVTMHSRATRRASDEGQGDHVHVPAELHQTSQQTAAPFEHAKRIRCAPRTACGIPSGIKRLSEITT